MGGKGLKIGSYLDSFIFSLGLNMRFSVEIGRRRCGVGSSNGEQVERILVSRLGLPSTRDSPSQLWSPAFSRQTLLRSGDSPSPSFVHRGANKGCALFSTGKRSATVTIPRSQPQQCRCIFYPNLRQGSLCLKSWKLT